MAAKGRIPAIDLARGVALIAMAVFHFAWDLENFGIARAGLTLEPQWKYFARAIAASFLFLVGVSLYLAHSGGVDRRAVIKRVALVGGAAAAITIVTWFATPDGFIFFGILHNIALSSLLALAFLRVPWWAVLAAAVAVLTAPAWARTEWLDVPVWWWTGLSQVTPVANDYVPVFPWFGWVLVGLGVARLAGAHGVFDRLSKPALEFQPAGLLRFFGRHSLIFYLVHQPILIAGLYLVTVSAGI